MADKEQVAIKRLKMASAMSMKYYKKPLIVTTSGGKDSSVCVQLAQAAGIPFEVEHNHTTADAPETVLFVRQEFKRLEEKGITCRVNMPMFKGKRTSMWALIVKKLMPPTRTKRYCCDILKERGGVDRMITTGVRWAESEKRKNTRGIYEMPHRSEEKRIILQNDNDDTRRLFESCALKAKRVCNPIIDWSDEDVWDYISSEKIPMNPLYKEGFARVGCIGCPMAGTKGRCVEFARWPKYRNLYINAFDRMIAERERLGKKNFMTRGIDVFHWWMEDGVLPGQVHFEELEEWRLWNEGKS